MGSLCSCFRPPEVEESERPIHPSWFGRNVTSKGTASSSATVVPNCTPLRTECQLAENVNPQSEREQVRGSNAQTTLKINSVGETKSVSYCMNEHVDSAAEDEDVCPTCFEEYTPENPKIVTNCHHEYHLSCIYEWMERSEKCPICAKLLIFDEPN